MSICTSTGTLKASVFEGQSVANLIGLNSF